MINKVSITPDTRSDISIEEKISFLKQARAYPHPVTNEEVRETHMSWIFLANGIVYKLKKPVTYNFLDFRTLDARFKNCQEEVRLNKRLAGDRYYGAVPLVLNERGELQLEGKGYVVEWLVKMKRIAEENFLDHAIKHQHTEQSLIEAAANLLAEFYKQAQPVYIKPDIYQKKSKDEIISTYRELLVPLYHFPRLLIERISTGLLRFLDNRSALFNERISNGKIIEAHGDLKPEHICLAPRPAIIDALEFNSDLRRMDIAEELSFFYVECEVIGGEATGKLFFYCYRKISSDNIPGPLISYYKAKKAFLRTYLVARHITEPGYKDEPKWLNKANMYLQLAKKYSDKLTG